MTNSNERRRRQFSRVLNVRLDEGLSSELRRIAAAKGASESDIARQLLEYGAEVERRLEAQQLMRHYAERDERPGFVEIDARWRSATDEELEAGGIS